MTDTSAPAFPSSSVTHDIPEMTLRDWFAGQALIGLASCREWDTHADIAGLAYGLAGAMLAERARK